MDAFVVNGGISLRGEIVLSGAKNVALKICLAALLTDETVVVHNVPEISDVLLMVELLSNLGVKAFHKNHTLTLNSSNLNNSRVPLELGARLRTSSMVIGPLISRLGTAIIPNPGGCRIGARPIDRHIESLKKMGVKISYNSNDGYFYTQASKLKGADIVFRKNTHTGTETLILAAVKAEGQTVINNAACEVEVDDLINCLNSMGASIKRIKPRVIVVRGVNKLHGTEYSIMSDRNEEVTLAVAAAVTNGKIQVNNSQRQNLDSFLPIFKKAGGIYESKSQNITVYSSSGKLYPSDVTTSVHPGFMTDWQGPWALLDTQANGISTIHETVFENRFSYVSELVKMGAMIEFFEPKVKNPKAVYNFNQIRNMNHQAIRVFGPKTLHNAVLQINDLRAGATILLAALIAEGESYITGVDQIDRGYEDIDRRLMNLGARIKRQKEVS